MDRKLLNDIVEATILYELAPQSSVEDMIRWYVYALEQDMVEYEYGANGELLGFMDWMRVPRKPVSLDDARQLYKLSPGGPYGIIGNVFIAEGAPRGLLRELGDRTKDKNPDVEVVCWHNKKTGKMVYRKVMKNIRRQICEETAV